MSFSVKDVVLCEGFDTHLRIILEDGEIRVYFNSSSVSVFGPIQKENEMLELGEWLEDGMQKSDNPIFNPRKRFGLPLVLLSFTDSFDFRNQ